MAPAGGGGPGVGAGGVLTVPGILSSPSHLSPGACHAFFERAAVRRVHRHAGARSRHRGPGPGPRRPAAAAGEKNTRGEKEKKKKAPGRIVLVAAGGAPGGRPARGWWRPP